MDHPGPHAAEVARHADLPAVPRHVPAPAPPASAGPDVVVYGYWPYWTGDLDPAWLSGVTHLSVFNVDLNSDGTLSSESNWTSVAADTVAAAHAAGVKVHLCITSFDEGDMEAVLGSSTRRAAVIDRLATLVDQYGADGVNVDFEGLPTSMTSEFVTFVQELQVATPEVWLALPVIDWAGAYDYDQLAAASDGLFIMGYAFHGSWGDPGPQDPLYGSDLWGSYSLAWSLADYETYGASRAHIVMGLPLYGYTWEVSDNSVPTDATGDVWSVSQVNCEAIWASDGSQWDDASSSPYALGSGEQTWCDDVEATRLRVEWAVDEGLLGVGFWALGYEGAGFWEMMADATDLPDAGGDTGGTGDGGAGDGGVGDGGGAAGDAGAEPVGERIPAPGCACSSGARPGAGAAWGLLLLGLAGLRRRQRG